MVNFVVDGVTGLEFAGEDDQVILCRKECLRRAFEGFGLGDVVPGRFNGSHLHLPSFRNLALRLGGGLTVVEGRTIEVQR